MAITVHNPGVTAACNSIVDFCESGAVGGFIAFHNAAHTVVCQIALSSPTAFADAALSANSGNASAAVPISATVEIASGTIEHFHVFTSASVTIWSGLCTTGTGDFVFTNLNGATGDTIVITAWNFIIGATAA